VDEVRLTFDAVEEPRPGARWQARFERTWPAYRAWFLRDGDAARPSYAVARARLREYMPELVPAWNRLVELAGGGDLAARMLALYDPPPLVSGCSQAVFAGETPVLVRNYDFDAERLEGVIYATALTGRRVLGMSDCLWGLLDGINDAGLAVSLAFGGRRVTRPGFGISLIVRYLLETCETTAQALDALARLPVQGAYNLTLLDAAGAAATAHVAPDGPPVRGPVPMATNHQHVADWPEHAAATATREREDRMLALLADPAVDERRFLDAFLVPPLHSRAYDHGFGTLYTAVYRPGQGAAEYRWPGCEWRQSLDAFADGSRTLRLPVSNRANDWSHVKSGQRYSARPSVGW
jgi:predicted choloylglycine hydrolase